MKAVFAPRRSISALVASVVPWMTMPISDAAAMPASATTISMPSRIACSGMRIVGQHLGREDRSPDIQRHIGEGAADIGAKADVVFSFEVMPCTFREASAASRIWVRVCRGVKRLRAIWQDRAPRRSLKHWAARAKAAAKSAVASTRLGMKAVGLARGRRNPGFQAWCRKRAPDKLRS
jgi:hypothetical protein